MRKLTLSLLTLLATVLVGCVTINVYFPEAAAQKAADQFIGNVLGGSDNATPATAPDAAKPTPKTNSHPPSAMLLDLLIPAASAADAPDIQLQNPATIAIRGRMRARFQGMLGGLLSSGAVGFTDDGMVAMHDVSKVPLNQRAQATATVADENNDRHALYSEVAKANSHPEWEAQIRATFAKGWISKARTGWYVQNAAGAWQRK